MERPVTTADAPYGLCLDKGYDDNEVRTIRHVFGWTACIRSRSAEACEIVWEASKKVQRLVAERSYHWLNRFRYLLLCCEKRTEYCLAFLHFAHGLVAFRAAGLFG